MKIKHSLLLSTLAASVIGTNLVNAAERNFLRDNDIKLSAHKLGQTSINAINDLKSLVGLSGLSSLKVKKTLTDDNGSTTTRYEQTYGGLPVIGDDVIVSLNADGTFKRAHGAVLLGIDNDLADVTPQIETNTAISIAKKYTQPTIDVVPSFSGEKSRLGIWLDKSGKAKLVYEVSYVQHTNKPSRPHLIVDAKTGEVLDFFDNLQTSDATGPGGNEKTGEYYYGVDFGSLNVTEAGSTCTMENENVKTINLNHRTSGSDSYSFTCPENTFKTINGAYSPLNDAHFFGDVVFNMYNDWVGSPPLTFQLQMKVHYSRRYENAFWDGSSMTFGDGANTFYPLVSLDVSSHEVSHGYTEQNSNLVYSGKSGGLNEAFSDMAGEAAEYYMLGENDWLVGAQIFKGEGALRYMNNPPLDGRSIDNQADFTNGMDVHFSSGVYNKAFYLLAISSGWDTQKAFQVYARANSNYWTSNVDWDQAGDGVMDAACDLGFDVDQVEASLSAVGVSSSVSDGSVCNGSSNPVPIAEFTESCTDLVCSFDGANSFDDGTIESYEWDFGDGAVATGVNTEHSYFSAGTYTVSLTVTDDLGAMDTASQVVTVIDPTNGGLDPKNEVITDVSIDRRSYKRFEVELEDGYSNFTVTTSEGTGNLALYVRPSSGPAACKSRTAGNDETCVVANPAGGTWYIDLVSGAASSGITLEYTATP